MLTLISTREHTHQIAVDMISISHLRNYINWVIRWELRCECIGAPLAFIIDELAYPYNIDKKNMKEKMNENVWRKLLHTAARWGRLRFLFKKFTQKVKIELFIKFKNPFFLGNNFALNFSTSFSLCRRIFYFNAYTSMCYLTLEKVF
jgi:hypothetical protein